jgi:hypothetical protein
MAKNWQARRIELTTLPPPKGKNSMQDVRHPHVRVKLIGEDGNVFFILGRVSQAMKREQVSDAEQKAFMAEAMSNDYDHALRVVDQWVTADSDPEDSWNHSERIDCDVCAEGDE